MSDILLDVQSPSLTPAAGQIVVYGDSVSKKLQAKNDAGLVSTLGNVQNVSTANQTGFAADTYMTGSGIAIPASLAKVGSIYRFRFDMVKTAAGVATPIIIVRFGTAGTTADAARLTFTFAAGTAAIDTGVWELSCHFRSIGVAGVLTGMAKLDHHLAATGLSTTGAAGTGVILVTSAAFDTTVAASIIGVSFNGGAAFSGTNTLQQAELINV
jgi:hypothetical protein